LSPEKPLGKGFDLVRIFSVTPCFSRLFLFWKELYDGFAEFFNVIKQGIFDGSTEQLFNDEGGSGNVAHRAANSGEIAFDQVGTANPIRQGGQGGTVREIRRDRVD
jgi:hypothetical protein